MCERVYQEAAAITVDPITLISVVLAALAVLLTVLAIMIAVAAVWGYVGLRDSVKEMASKKVDEAMLLKLKEYPDAAQMVNLVRRVEKYASFLDAVQNKVITSPDPKLVATASIAGIQEDRPETPIEAPSGQVTQIANYPGEEGDVDASGAGKSE
jgi:hypothetical protein